MTSRLNYIQLVKGTKEEHEEKGFSFDGEFYVWDYRYYDRKYVEESLFLEYNIVKDYFRYRLLFQPSWTSIKIFFEALQDASTWHSGMFVSFSTTLTLPNETFFICEDVQAFSVWKKDAKDASRFHGYCYLDFFPRGMHFFLLLTLSNRLRTE